MKVINDKLLKEYRSKQCAECGGSYGVVAHHVHARNPRIDLDFNLVPLCSGLGTNNCHGKVHQLGCVTATDTMIGYRDALISKGWKIKKIFPDSPKSLEHSDLWMYRQ